jgi:hypothetical protein
MDRILRTPEEIKTACESGGLVIFVGDECPLEKDGPEDGLIAVKAVGSQEGDQTFFVIALRENYEQAMAQARQIVEQFGGTIVDERMIH